MKKLNEEIREGTLKQAYLLCGDEAYLRRQYRDRVKKALMGDGDLMNLNCFEGKGIVPGEVVDLAQTMPFLAERRVLVIETAVFSRRAGRILRRIWQTRRPALISCSWRRRSIRGVNSTRRSRQRDG